MKVNIEFLVGVAKQARKNVSIARSRAAAGIIAEERLEAAAGELETLYQQLSELAGPQEESPEDEPPEQSLPVN
ncbi:MAG: hypothetical protein GY906_11215 [bacterium]|nr:hypothetical protein [bacterium]